MPNTVSQAQHEEQKLRYNERARKFAYNNHGRWSQEDKDRVLDHSIPDSVLAKELGRSIQAVQAVRNRIGFAKGGIYV